MARRKFFPVESLPLVGGRLCLDFVNTTGARASGAPRERLWTYADLLTWSRRVGIFDPSEERRLKEQAAVRSGEAQQVLERVREVREGLYRLLRAVTEGREPPAEEVERLSGCWQEDRGRRELVSEPGGFDLRLRVGADELDRMLWPVIDSAVGLLTSGDLSRVKRCGECDWLFFDASKNRSRTWCKTQGCGDRVRARRHYDRVRRRNGAAE